MNDIPHLLVRFNMAVIKDVPLDKDETSIGRKSTNDLVLDNQAVSGVHCKIRKEKDGYTLVDMDSTNGTFINGRKVTREPLKHKDQLRIARYSVEFLWESKTVGEINVSAEQVNELTVDKAPEKTTEGSQPYVGDAPVKTETVPQQIGATLKGDRVLPPAHGIVKIISGGDQTEIKLTELMTYIGTAPQALIKIKGFMAPELAAAISRRPDGYFLKAIKPGLAKVNGMSVNDQIFLESGALIEAGGTNMVFYVNEEEKTDKKMDGK